MAKKKLREIVFCGEKKCDKLFYREIDPVKLEPITFDTVNNAYIKLGEKVGNVFSDGLALT